MSGWHQVRNTRICELSWRTVYVFTPVVCVFVTVIVSPEQRHKQFITAMQTLHYFAVLVHSPKVRAVKRDCRWDLKNSGNSYWSRDPIVQWDTRQSQYILRPINHNSAMSAIWRPCVIPHQGSYCHQTSTVSQSKQIIFFLHIYFLPYVSRYRQILK